MPPQTNSYPLDRVFTRARIDDILDKAKGLTLGQADTLGLIDKAMLANPDKVQKGIAGDVIELSVLGCKKRDSNQAPDVLVDNVLTELKTTGVIQGKKATAFKAKEPITITNISPDITKESFETSPFFHKLEHLLFVFYHYNCSNTAKCSEDYKPFPILGHLFWQVPSDSLAKLKKDWQVIKEFAEKHSFLDDTERHEMRKLLMHIDYSSPKQPRFRLKQAFATTIVETFLKKSLESLPQEINTFDEFDKRCMAFTQMYGGKSLGEISNSLGISIRGKDQCQRLVIKMFGGQAKSINQIKDFKELGIVAKTLVLTSTGKRTEDMKMFNVDFQEWLNPATAFSEEQDNDNALIGGYSEIQPFFNESQFLFIVFQEPYKPAPKKKVPLNECLFKGFKRYNFKEEFINTSVYRAWIDSRELVFSKQLKEARNAPNFPKSRDNLVFFRGSGRNSKDKKAYLSDWGIDFKMYSQWIWVKGKYIVNELSEIPYL